MKKMNTMALVFFSAVFASSSGHAAERFYSNGKTSFYAVESEAACNQISNDYHKRLQAGTKWMPMIEAVGLRCSVVDSDSRLLPSDIELPEGTICGCYHFSESDG